MQTERRVAANPQTKPTDLVCESADTWNESVFHTIADRMPILNAWK